MGRINEELEDLYGEPKIAALVKAQRLIWTHKQNASVKNTKNNTVNYNKREEEKKKTLDKMDLPGSEAYTGPEH